MKVRPGYTSYASTVAGAGGIRTVIPFEGALTEKLFVVTSAGIYDITAGGAGPWTAAPAFPTTTDPAGWGTWSNFVSDAGTHYVFYADEQNGLYRYPEGGPFAAVTDITGVNELDLVFVTQHKARMWFIQRDSADAWYLGSGAISGAATVFHFGNKFKHGGNLVGLYTWTVDGGDGIDDHLVAISSGGDVMVYRGTDPGVASDWNLVGQWYVGALPVGRRVANNETGDLYIISQYGVIPLTRLMQGQLVQQEATQLSRNIAPLVATAMKLTLNTRGWELRNVPKENVFVLARPAITGFSNLQFALSTRTYGWTTFQDLPYQTGDTWNGEFYFGDTNGTLWTFNNTTDNGVAITFNMVTSFQDYGETGSYHRVQFMRPVYRAGGAPTIQLEARYDYNLDAPVLGSSAIVTTGSLWDVALWDTAIWGGEALIAQTVVAGQGTGRAMAVALAGSSTTETTLIRVDIMYDTGGYL